MACCALPKSPGLGYTRAVGARLATILLLSCTACTVGCPVTLEPRIQVLDSVAEAPTHDPSYDALRFSGVARTDLAGFVTWTAAAGRHANRSAHTAALIPIVPPGWTPEMPIPLWIRTDAASADPHSRAVQTKLNIIRQAVSAGPITVATTQHLKAEVDMEGTNAFQIGARRAMLKYSLTSPVGAPLATWPVSNGKLRWAD